MRTPHTQCGAHCAQRIFLAVSFRQRWRARHFSRRTQRSTGGSSPRAARGSPRRSQRLREATQPEPDNGCTRKTRGNIAYAILPPSCCHWETRSSVTDGAGVLECQGTQHVLQIMLMIHPDQAGSLQGSCRVSSSILAVNDPGTGSGWQQSKQNWALLAVVGKWSRMACSDHCCGELSPLHSFLECGSVSALSVWRLGPCAWPC